jgi:hypothetical protein
VVCTRGVFSDFGEYGVKLLIIASLFVLSPVWCCATDWSRWAQLDDGALNGVEFSHRSDCPVSAKDPACALRWRFMSNYEEPTDVDFTLSWETAKGLKKKTQRVKLKPGENSSTTFSVSGTALDEVSVRLIADPRTISAARQALTEAQQLQEQQQRQALEQQEQERAAQEQKVKDRQRFAALTRKEQQRREDEARQQQEEQAARQQEAAFRQQEAAQREQEAEAQARRDRKQQAEEDAEAQERSDEARSRRSEENTQMWKNAINGISQSLQNSADKSSAAWGQVAQMNQEVAEQKRRQKEERERRAEDARLSQQRDAQRQQEREDARRAEQAQERERLAQAQRRQEEQQRQQDQQRRQVAQTQESTRQIVASAAQSERGESDERRNYTFARPATDCITTFINTKMSNWLAYRNKCSSTVHVFFANPGFGSFEIGPGKVETSGRECGDGCTPLYVACPEGYTELNTDMTNYLMADLRAGKSFQCGKHK